MARRTRKQLTPEQRAEIIAQARELADRAAAALAAPNAGERIAATVGMSPRIASYSIRNQMLLMEQAEERGIALRDVDTFKGWLSRGRCVRRGERGLKIVRPVGMEQTEQADAGDNADPGSEQRSDEQTERVRFRIMTVFEVSQTEIVDEEAAAADTSTNTSPEQVWTSLGEQVQRAGYLFNWPSDTTEEPVTVDHDARIVHVRPDLDPADPRAVAVLAGALAEILTQPPAAADAAGVPQQRNRRHTDAGALTLTVA